MTTVAYPGATGQVGVTDAANFIPELWSDEIVATYKSNLVMPQLVVTLNHVGKKGDTIHIPPRREMQLVLRRRILLSTSSLTPKVLRTLRFLSIGNIPGLLKILLKFRRLTHYVRFIRMMRVTRLQLVLIQNFIRKA